jgi:hypothetical protein
VLKLPKDLTDHPRHDAILKALSTQTAPLWERGTHAVATLSLNPKLRQELGRALELGFAIQGLEQIGAELMREQKGLDALKEKTPQAPQSSRISRILLVANDGSERFYRECESLLNHYSQRLLVCRLDVAGEDLGLALTQRPKLLRALLVTDRKAAARVLLALAPV